MYNGITLDFFQLDGNFQCVIERLIMWVTTCTISGLISLMVEVSILSRPEALELFNEEMILSTWSGCTVVSSWKEHCLPIIKASNLQSAVGFGRLDLMVLIYSMKNSF